MRISTKLIVHTVIVAVFSVLVSTVLIGWMGYSNADHFLEELAIARFISLRDAKVNQIEDYYSTIEKQVVTFANDYTIIQAMQDFAIAFNEYTVPAGKAKYKPEVVNLYVSRFVTKYTKLNPGSKVDNKTLLNLADDRSFTLQYNYIVQNPYPTNKSQYEDTQDGSKYNAAHKKFQSLIRSYQEKFKFNDILLVESKTGNIIYSVQKDLDYTTSLINGPYAQSVIGDAFRQANAATSKDTYAITDFSAYAPAYSNAIACIAAPIFDEANKKIGVLIFKLSPDYINSVMTSNDKWEQSGWGKTGESYILGADFILRTESRFFVEDPSAYLKQMYKLGVNEQTLQFIGAKKTTIGLQKIISVGARNVVAGKTGVSFYKDYRKQPVIAAYAPLHIKGLDWGVICGIDTVEAFATAHLLAHKVIVYGLLMIVLISTLAIFVGFRLSKIVSGPLEKLKNIIYFLAKKQDLTKRIKVDTEDELGDIARALNALLTNLQKAFQETINSTKQVQTAAAKLYTTSEHINQEMLANIPGISITAMQDKVKATEETVNSLQILSSRLENLSKQFKIFEDESDRTSGW